MSSIIVFFKFYLTAPPAAPRRSDTLVLIYIDASSLCSGASLCDDFNHADHIQEAYLRDRQATEKNIWHDAENYHLYLVADIVLSVAVSLRVNALYSFSPVSTKSAKSVLSAMRKQIYG